MRTILVRVIERSVQKGRKRVSERVSIGDREGYRKRPMDYERGKRE